MDHNLIAYLLNHFDQKNGLENLFSAHLGLSTAVMAEARAGFVTIFRDS